MKVECSQCGHLGPAEDVRQGDDGVEVVCEACGATNSLDAESSSVSDGTGSNQPNDDSPHIGEADLSALEHQTSDPSTYGSPDLTLEEEEALDRLVPERGDGIRCPKCAALLPDQVDNCRRCGLNLDEARGYDDGEAPWQQPRPGWEAEREQAELLWSAYRESGEDDDLTRFVDFVDEHRMFEMAIRRLRFYLVDHPDADGVHEALARLASGVQTQVVTARAQAEADAEELNEEIKQFKRRVAVGIIIGGTLMVLIAASFVW